METTGPWRPPPVLGKTGWPSAPHIVFPERVRLTWLDPRQLDDGDLAAVVALREAARQADAPHRLSDTVGSVTAHLRHGWDGEPPSVGLARDERRRPIGMLSLSLPSRDNTHVGSVVVTVDPLLRRRGLGRRLLEIGLGRLRDEGRTLLLGYGADTPALSGFATAMEMERVLTLAHRRQDVRAPDQAMLEREWEAACVQAKDYELVRVTGATPDDLLPAVVTMTAALNDAPTDGLDTEDLVYSPERIRAYEAAQHARGDRFYRLMARSRDTGELGGHSVVTVDHQRPWWGSQHDTSVVRAHRGHRLGVFLKIGMMRWLAEQEPQLHSIDTTNAASNTHMIRVNELLGYRLVATSCEWQRRL
jgi:RimJ/RimL family protein N-acetyltransferase/GNAT superfamily N-acetyltransferase